MKQEKTFIHILMHIGRLLDLEISRELSTIDLHHAQGRCLLFLSRHPGINQASLARKMRIKASTVTNMLKPLKAKGLVIDSVDQNNNRSLNLSLSQEGLKLVEKVQDAWHKVERKIAFGIREEEKQSIFYNLEKIRHNLGGEAPPHEKDFIHTHDTRIKEEKS